MKKLFLSLLIGAASITSNASDGKIKSETFPTSLFECGTASSTVSGECWEVEVTVTYCNPDLGSVEATAMAMLSASRAAGSYASLVQLLDELAPC